MSLNHVAVLADIDAVELSHCAECGAPTNGAYRCESCTRKLAAADRGVNSLQAQPESNDSAKGAAIFWGLGANVHAAWQLARSRRARGLPTKGWAAGTLVFTALPVLGVFVFSAVYGGLPWSMVLGALLVVAMLAVVSTGLVRWTSAKSDTK